jgi:hypothetical protein
MSLNPCVLAIFQELGLPKVTMVPKAYVDCCMMSHNCFLHKFLKLPW